MTKARVKNNSAMMKVGARTNSKAKKFVEAKGRFTHTGGAIFNYKERQPIPTQCQRKHEKGKGNCPYIFSRINNKY